MPTVEDYFDDDTDLPLPPTASGSKPRGLQGQGLKGALLEEIGDDADTGFDYERMAEDSRGVFGEDARAPPPQAYDPSGKGKVAVRDSDQELRPSGGPGGEQGKGGPMGGFMGDMMRMQQLEEERLEKLRKQFGSATIAADPSVYKEWNSLYPLYFDAKASVSRGRRVSREKGLWWPQAQHISFACRSLGLQSCLEPNRTHPADFENPGRVKVQFQKEGKFLNPMIKNRSQLYNRLAEQMMREYPKLAYLNAPAVKPKPKRKLESEGETAVTKQAKGKGKGKKANKNNNKKTETAAAAPLVKRLRTRPPLPPHPLLPLDQRLPLHSPLAETGIAVSSIKRDLETEKENKKKGITGGGGGEAEGTGAGQGAGKDKQPKMKRMVVRGKR